MENLSNEVMGMAGATRNANPYCFCFFVKHEEIRGKPQNMTLGFNGPQVGFKSYNLQHQTI